jgi:hypothetical protein
LRLVIVGHVLRAEPGAAVVRIDRHEFKTSLSGLNAAAHR